MEEVWAQNAWLSDGNRGDGIAVGVKQVSKIAQLSDTKREVSIIRTGLYLSEIAHLFLI
jgi:hypothetical protein